MRTGEHGVAAAKLSLCAFRVGEETFGIEPHAVREALRKFELRSVPLAHAVVAGVLAYRGDMLAAISLRVALGLEKEASPACALVLHDGESGELFALLIDGLVDVVQVEAREWEPNPPTLNARQSALFRGAYRTANGPLVRIDIEQLQPSRWLQKKERGVGRGDAQVNVRHALQA